MLLDAIATVILAGMMLIPIANLFVGAVVGASLGGLPGGIAGFVVAVAVTAVEKLLGDRRGWFELRAGTGDSTANEEHIPVRKEICEVSANALQAPKRRQLVIQQKRHRRRSLPMEESSRASLKSVARKGEESMANLQWAGALVSR